MKYLTVLLLSGVISAGLEAQERKSVEATLINSVINVDGVLNESVYNTTNPARNFVQMQPFNGKPSFQPTEVYFLYDQTAIYVGARLFDSAPDSIYNFLSERDVPGSSDIFGVYFDPYNQGQLAYGFVITPAGVQSDLKSIKSDHDYEDFSWDAVWYGKTRITEEGWVVEMKIPFSALRFPDNGNGTWGLNIFRNIRRYNSIDSWNLVNREVSGVIHQQGNLTGMNNIRSPLRLSLMPYAAVYSEFREDKKSPEWMYKGGMDLKYGLSESFTLDMMLIPDFGQIQSDDQQLNLTPYELYYSERRQFFTEGTELFNRAGIFYSRRIGASPKFSYKAGQGLDINETVIESPSETQLLNATKVSGRTLKGDGLGILNAITLPSYATIIDTMSGIERKQEIQPFTNYNVMVFDKSLKNNSYFSVINSNVAMANDPFFSNVTATDFQLRNSSKSYVLKGKGGLSLRRTDNNETGYFAQLEAGKNSGKLQYGLSQTVYSDRYNPNDLGYLRRNNEYNLQPYLNYNLLEPFGIFREIRINNLFIHNRVYRQFKFASNEVHLMMTSVFKNNHTAQFHLHYYGDGNNFYEPRSEGRFYRDPYRVGLCLFYGTNNVKPVSIFAGYNHFIYPGSDQASDWANAQLNLRLGRRFTFNYQALLTRDYNNKGFGGMTASQDSVFFTCRNVQTVNNVISSAFMLSNKATVNVRFRHYWSGVMNKRSFLLQGDGTLSDLPGYGLFKNENYNTINLDLNFRWIFSPGSEISVAWKNYIIDRQDELNRDYWENLESTWVSAQTNSFSVRLLYYLDYNMLRKRTAEQGL